MFGDSCCQQVLETPCCTARPDLYSPQDLRLQQHHCYCARGLFAFTFSLCLSVDDSGGNIQPLKQQQRLMLHSECQKLICGDGEEGRRVPGLRLLLPLRCPFSNHVSFHGSFSLHLLNVAVHLPAGRTELHTHFQMGANLLPHPRGQLERGQGLNPAAKGCKSDGVMLPVGKHAELRCLPSPWLVKSVLSVQDMAIIYSKADFHPGTLTKI